MVMRPPCLIIIIEIPLLGWASSTQQETKLCMVSFHKHSSFDNICHHIDLSTSWLNIEYKSENMSTSEIFTLL